MRLTILILIGGSEKANDDEYMYSYPTHKRRNHYAGLCHHLKISQVSNHKTSITLLRLRNVVKLLTSVSYFSECKIIKISAQNKMPLNHIIFIMNLNAQVQLASAILAKMFEKFDSRG